MEIRPAVPDDAPAIARVQIASWRAGYAGLLPADMLAGLDEAEWARHRRAHLESGVRVLVLTDPRITAFAAFGPARDEPGAGQLYAFYVNPDRWRTGRGSALMGAVRAELDAAHPRSLLWVLRGNARAIAFYGRHGWLADGGAQVETGPGDAVLDEIRLVRTRSPGSPPAPSRPDPSAPPTPPAAPAR